ncbi:MAG: winged helix-turn-helix transcriptional regulator, partial [Anaerolineales bacterium]|nr:winged helix-turn-helix transcriptional regulator [Anaerolineales bacterium]
IDCQELGGSPPEEVYEALLIGVREAAEEAELNVTDPKQTGTYRALDRLLNQVVRSGVAVVVILDEFELLAANEQLTPYFFARLRGLTTKYGLAYLTASQRPLFAITADEEILSSPFFNIFVSLSLGLFTAEEAQGLLDERLADTAVSFSPDLQTHILRLVGPHPFFLHLAGYHAFPLVAGGEYETASQIDKPTEVEAESHLAYLWQNLTGEERYGLATLAGGVDVLRSLEQQCLIEAVSTAVGESSSANAAENNTTYTYTSQILERFVRRQDVPGLIQADPFVIDFQRHTVRVPEKELSLTTSQFNLLVCLAEQAGQVVHAHDLERAVWQEALLDDPDRLKTLIKRLRRAIEPYDNWVVSERGVGYALRMPE